LKYIESMQNARVKQWKKLLTKKDRDKSGLFLVEGFHLVEEALTHGLVEELILKEGTDLPLKWDLGAIELFTVHKEIFKAIADTDTPQGIAAVCRKPTFPELGTDITTALLIDRVQDPGNIGTMIRTADAAGFDAVILGDGCADAYSPKVVRSTQGSLFHIPILKGSLDIWVEKLKQSGVKVYGTALQGAKPYKEISAGNRFAILVGNEGSGVSKELLAKTDQNVYIPIHGKSESLNVAVAAGILMYALK
jgi:TrmH family RNA methyltransferase